MDDEWGQDDYPPDGVFNGTFDGSATHYVRLDSTVGEQRTAMEFLISAIPSGRTITSANLRLTLTYATSTTANVEVHGYTGNGTIGLSDYTQNNLLGSFTGDYDTDTFPKTVNVDVTSHIQSLYSSSQSYAGFNLRTTNQNSQGLFQAVESSNSTNIPQLTIEYSSAPATVPEPSHLVTLVAGALTGVAGWQWSRFRRRREIGASR